MKCVYTEDTVCIANTYCVQVKHVQRGHEVCVMEDTVCIANTYCVQVKHVQRGHEVCVHGMHSVYSEHILCSSETHAKRG